LISNHIILIVMSQALKMPHTKQFQLLQITRFHFNIIATWSKNHFLGLHECCVSRIHGILQTNQAASCQVRDSRSLLNAKYTLILLFIRAVPHCMITPVIWNRWFGSESLPTLDCLEWFIHQHLLGPALFAAECFIPSVNKKMKHS
jgi:hypothetical protein